jgi:hypothetical protein
MTAAMDQPTAREYKSGKMAARRDYALGHMFHLPYGAPADYREGYEDQWIAEQYSDAVVRRSL